MLLGKVVVGLLVAASAAATVVPDELSHPLLVSFGYADRQQYGGRSPAGFAGVKDLAVVAAPRHGEIAVLKRWGQDEGREVAGCGTGLTVEEDVSFYDVRGGDAKLAKISYESNKPLGYRFDGTQMRPAGLTNWQISYKFCREQVGSLCTLSSLETKLRIRYLMPRWLDKRVAQRQDRVRFDKFFERLMTYESGHGKIAREGAEKFHAVILRLGGSDNCDALDQVIEGAAGELIEEIKTRQDTYDRETRHGITQGIGYPFR